MKTVVYLISTLKRSGPTNVLAGIVKNLDKNKYKPIVITLSPESEEDNSWWGELEAQGVSVYSLNLSRLQGVFFAKRQLTQLLAKIRPDIIHAHCFRSALLISGLKNYKKIITVHCDWNVDFKMRYGRICGTIMDYLYTRAIRKIDVRVACSSMLANLLNKKYPALHFDFVDNGVDTDRFHPTKDKVFLRQKLGLPQDKKIIIWVGNFLLVKAPLTMARTVLQLPENQYFFVFCGARGSLLSTCKELLKNRSDVLFTGYITNIEQYYQAADIYVSTSLSEGFHLTVYEAMACGLPVVLTDIDVYSNLKQNQAVKFFPIQDISYLTNNLISLVQQDLNQLGVIASQTVEQNYSAAKMAQNYMEKYL